MKDWTIQTIIGVCGGVASLLYGEIQPAFASLIALIVIDFVTGLMHAIIEQNLNSKTCAKGIAKKVFILALVAVGHLVDNVAETSVCMSVVTFFYIANESMSIIENAGKIGLPVPKKLIAILEQLNGKETEE